VTLIFSYFPLLTFCRLAISTTNDPTLPSLETQPGWPCTPTDQLQVANEINARRINDEYNVFEGLTKSPIFMGVIVITMGLQAIIMNFLGMFFVVGADSWDHKLSRGRSLYAVAGDCCGGWSFGPGNVVRGRSKSSG
jgi:hypothetical protein